MSDFLTTTRVREVYASDNCAFVLSDNSDFQLMEYTVIKNWKRRYVPCLKSIQNGSVKLTYFKEDYCRFTDIIQDLDGESVLLVIANLIKIVQETEETDVLNRINLMIDADKVFVHKDTKLVRLIYFPLECDAERTDEFDSCFRKILVNLLVSIPSLSQGSVKKLCDAINNTMNDIGALYEIVAASYKGIDLDTVWNHSHEDGTGGKELSAIFKSKNAATPVCFVIKGDRFRIGKNPSLVHGVITFNKAISRLHCEIIRKNNSFYLVDLKSVNGTYLNSVKLEPEHPSVLKNGDTIRLANSDFVIEIKEG